MDYREAAQFNNERIIIMKRFLALLTAFLVLCSTFGALAMTASAANYTSSYWNYTEPSGADYAYWNGKRMVKHSGTWTTNIKWMQASLNWCIRNKGLSASLLDVDGSFGPASKKATIAFQRKFGLSADGSFGPSTIQRMKDVQKGKYPKQQSTSSSSSKTLNIDWSLIKKTGRQKSGEKNCFCYALAYSRDIIDGRSHSWTEYSVGKLKDGSRYSYTAVPSKAGYSKKSANSASEVYKAMYNNIKNGKPVIINVNGGRSTGNGHFLAVVGYVNVKDVNKLSVNNFLIIDSCRKEDKTEILGGLGYYLRQNAYYVY